MQKTILTLDLSFRSTGYSVFDEKGSILAYGIVKPLSYPKHTADRYPVKTAKNGLSLGIQIAELVKLWNPAKIIIEEVNPKGGMSSVIGTKTLCALHFMVILQIMDYLERIEFMTSSDWRNTLGIKKHTDWKISTIEFINKFYSLNFKYADNDMADALALGAAYFKKLGIISTVKTKTKKLRKKS